MKQVPPVCSLAEQRAFKWAPSRLPVERNTGNCFPSTTSRPPSFIFTFVCNQSAPRLPLAPHPSHPHCQGGTTGGLEAAVNRLSSGREMETSCQIPCLLSRKLSPFLTDVFVVVVLSYFLFFTYLYSSLATPLHPTPSGATRPLCLVPATRPRRSIPL